MPEIIELLSSPEPEVVVRRGGRGRHGGGSGESKGGEGKGKEKGKEKEKEKEESEAEKIRELRLKRFGGSAGSPAAQSETAKRVEKEKAMSTTGDGNNRGKEKEKEKGARADATTTTDSSSAMKSSDSLNNAMLSRRGTTATMSYMKSHGAIDLTLDDDDDSDGNENEISASWKSPADTIANREKGSEVKHAEYSDPFRSSSPALKWPKSPVSQPSMAAAKSKASTVPASMIPEDFDDFSFNDTYDMEVPVAKRPRVSPKPNDAAAGSSARTMTKESGGLRRAISNVEKSSHRFQPKGKGLKRAKTMDSDPILFTSSPVHFDYKHKKAEKRKAQAEDSDDPFVDIDDLLSAPPPTKSLPGGLPRRSKSHTMDLDTILSDKDQSEGSDDLPDISNIKHAPRKSATQASRERSTTAVPSPARAKSQSSKAALTAWEKEKKAEKLAQEKANKAADKKAAAEAKKEEKRIEKENKAKEKERQAALAKANTLRTNKNDSTPEMIVDLPIGLDARLAEHTRVLLDGLGVEHAEWEAPIANVIKWRRKAESEWNDELDCWTPIEKHIKNEKHVLVIIKAEEFLDLINGEEGKDLVCHVLNMKGKCEDRSSGGKNIVYLIEGLKEYLKKIRNAKSRQSGAAVRSQMAQAEEEEGGIAAAAGRKKRKTKVTEVKDVDENAVEDALLNLQVLHNVLVYHVPCLADTAQWITVFTQHISTIPYRHKKLALQTTFCMDSGQRTKGVDIPDTFIKMLQETSRLTAPIAHGIASAYPSATQLVEAFERAGPVEGPLLLQDLKKAAGANGAWSDRRIGPALSRRVWAVWMGREAGSTDI